jgi:hypothetical protein
MIMFHNPGLIPLDAIRLMGASVKAEGAFGRFGTGIKYGIATILRGGGTIRIWVGAQEIGFEQVTTTIKGQTFHEVVMVYRAGEGQLSNYRVQLGFTTSLGKDWEPWMALREFACNALDEGGEWLAMSNDIQAFELSDLQCALNRGPEDTIIVVDWAEMDEAALSNQTFAPSTEPMLDERGVRVHAGSSEYLYHRGVRVWKLPKPSVFTYDVTAPVDLTEDRTVKYSFCVVAQVRNMLLTTGDPTIVAAAVSAGTERWEGSFDWTGQQWMPTPPGTTWLEEVSILRAAEAGGLSKSAVDVFLNHSAYQTSTQYSGGSYEEPMGTFGDVAEELSELGIRLKDINTFVAEELPGEARSTIRGGSVYVTKTLIDDGGRLEIAEEMLTRYLELKSGGNHDTLLALVVPLLLDQSYSFKQERELREARDQGLRATPVEAFLGLHPAPVRELLDDDVPF